MKFILILISILISLHAQSKGLWVTRFALMEENYANRLISFSIDNKITDVFLQLRGRADAFYKSEVEKNIHESVNQSDLIYLIDELKKNNVRVHAWLNVFVLASSFEQLNDEPDHILNRNKNWIDFTENLIAQSDFLKTDDDLKKYTEIEGLYTLPCFPEVLNYYKEIVLELIEMFPIDGIHFDYFRLADNDFGFHPKMRLLFAEKTGLNIESALNDQQNFNNFQLKEKWMMFVSEQFTSFLKSLTSLSNKVKWSVAVKPDPQDALFTKGQDWMTWLKKDIVDFVVPMNYTRSTGKFMNQVEFYRTLKRLNNRIWVGIATYNQSFASMKEKENIMIHFKMNYSLFSYNDLIEKNILILDK